MPYSSFRIHYSLRDLKSWKDNIQGEIRSSCTLPLNQLNNYHSSYFSDHLPTKPFKAKPNIVKVFSFFVINKKNSVHLPPFVFHFFIENIYYR